MHSSQALDIMGYKFPLLFILKSDDTVRTGNWRYLMLHCKKKKKNQHANTEHVARAKGCCYQNANIKQVTRAKDLSYFMLHHQNKKKNSNAGSSSLK